MKKVRYILLILLVVSIGVFVFTVIDANKSPVLIDDATSIQQGLREKKTEGIFCSVTVPSHCYLYRCNTAYIYATNLPPPGSNPLKCTDGSEIESVREVPPQD
jgi:hypothetical protein